MTEIEIKILKTVTQVMKPYLVNSENRILHSSLITALNEAFVQTGVNRIEEIISAILSDDYPYISPLDYEDEEVCRKKLRDLFEGLNLSS